MPRRRANFRMPFVDLGLVPEAASSLTVPLRVGMAKASECCCSARLSTRTRRIAAASSTPSCPRPNSIDTRAARGDPLAAKPPQAFAATRRLMRGDREIRAQMEKEREAFAVALKSPEAKAAFSAFLAKAKA